jgi:hypothetical protein
MSRGTPHFSKSNPELLDVFEDEDDGLNAARAVSPFRDYITDFLDQSLPELDPLSGAPAFEDERENDSAEALIAHQSLVAPFSNGVQPEHPIQPEYPAPARAVDGRDEGRQCRLVSSRPTSRVARQMQRDCPEFQLSSSQHIVAIRTRELLDLAEEWFSWTLDSGQSPRTVELRRTQIERLLWFLREGECEVCGTKQIRHFFRHLQDGHTLPMGRWGEGTANQGRRELRPATLATYDRHLRSFFHFLVKGRFLSASPMDDVPRQKNTADQVEPYTIEQINAFIRSAQRSKFPKRNEAIVRFLPDTGVRASELCGLRMGQVDLFGRRACTRQRQP